MSRRTPVPAADARTVDFAPGSGGVGRAGLQAGQVPAIGAWWAINHNSAITAPDACQWVFYDHALNHSSVWCTMSICGNRTKSRRAYERRKPGTARTLIECYPRGSL